MRSILLTIGCLIGPLFVVSDSTVADGDLGAAESNPIDALVLVSLRERHIAPSSLATDTEFLRRLSLTTIGQLPTARDVRAFVTDELPAKRARKIDELLNDPLHAAMWATRFCELTGNSIDTMAASDEVKPQLAQMWHDWLRERFAHNIPYDELVRAIVTATSRHDATLAEWMDDEVAMTLAMREGKATSYADRKSLDLFWRRADVDDQYPVRELAERIASAFVGVRINCARCHDHPFDRWTQDDYAAFVRIFAQVRYGMSPELRQEVAHRLQKRRSLVARGKSPGPPLPRLTEVYLAPVVSSANSTAPKPLGGQALAGDHRDYRLAFAAWLTDPRSEFFARNFANRVWAHYFGHGLVEPWDGHASDHSSLHSALLDELSARFVSSGYDIRHLESLILNSTTWQRSSRPNDSNRNDRQHFSRAYVRLPPAEVVVDMWHAATGIERDFGNDVPRGLKAVELGPDRLPGNRWDPFLQLFGQTSRIATCDCTPRGRPSIRQTLSLMSDPDLVADIARGELQRLLAIDMTNDELIDELFLRTLTRWPTRDERAAAMHACSIADRSEAFEDMLWSLLNTQEFITNH